MGAWPLANGSHGVGQVLGTPSEAVLCHWAPVVNPQSPDDLFLPTSQCPFLRHHRDLGLLETSGSPSLNRSADPDMLRSGVVVALPRSSAETAWRAVPFGIYLPYLNGAFKATYGKETS